MRIVNFVATAEEMVRLPLKIVAELVGGKYGPKVFPAVIVRSTRPKVTEMFMESGRNVISGAPTPEDAVYVAWLGAHRLMKEMPRLTRHISVYNVQVENIVATADVGFELDLKKLYKANQSKSVWQPKKIKPVRFYPHSPWKQKPVMVIYDTGRIIITGAETVPEVHATYKLLDWEKYRKVKDSSNELARQVGQLSLS